MSKLVEVSEDIEWLLSSSSTCESSTDRPINSFWPARLGRASRPIIGLSSLERSIDPPVLKWGVSER